MPIAPIKGTLSRKIAVDIGMSFVAGFALAYGYYFFEHRPVAVKRDAYYAQLKVQREAEENS